MRKKLSLTLFLGLAVSALFAACGDSDESDAIFSGSESAALGAAQNGATCLTCHANTAGVKGNPGNSMVNIAYHTSFKGGGAPTLLAGANACVAGWMGGVALKETDASWKKLESYLQSISDAAVTAPNPVAPEVLMNEAAYETAYTGGDAAAGAAKYALSCARCHDKGLRVGPAVSPGLATLKSRTIGRIAQQVRTSGPPPSGMADTVDKTPGPMPFFEPSDLSAADLKDIIAFVRQ